MKRVKRHEFMKIVGCSHQLIAYYCMKGMPKQVCESDRKANEYDLFECWKWAHDNKFFAFARKLHDALSSQPDFVSNDAGFPESGDINIEVDPFNELERRFDAFMSQAEKVYKLLNNREPQDVG